MINKGFEYTTLMGNVKVRDKYLISYFDVVEKTHHVETYNDFEQVKQEYEDIFCTIRYQKCFFTIIKEQNDFLTEDYNGECYNDYGENIYEQKKSN